MYQKNKKQLSHLGPRKSKKKRRRGNITAKKRKEKKRKGNVAKNKKKKKGTPRARKSTKKKEKKRPMHPPMGEEKKNEGYLKKLAVCTYTSAFLSIKKKFILTCILNKYYDRNCNIYY